MTQYLNEKHAGNTNIPVSSKACNKLMQRWSLYENYTYKYS
jgi:hypothetical protein